MLLLVTAVDAERDAAIRGLPPAPPVPRLQVPHRVVRGSATLVVAVAGGLGPVAAAVTTARLLDTLSGQLSLVVSAGLAGGFAGRSGVGDVLVADRAAFADLGAAVDDGFLGPSGLGLGADPVLECPAAGAAARRLVARDVPARVGTVLTLATMTGTDGRAAELAARWPAALGEAMEGYGVASAAVAADVPWLEIRAVSNLIGRRDRSRWDIPGALRGLDRAVAALASTEVR